MGQIFHPSTNTIAKVTIFGAAFFLAGQEKVPPRTAPAVGAHSGEVLRQYGYSDAEIAALRDAGVIA